MIQVQSIAAPIESDNPAWNAIVAIALGVAGLIIAEFLPAGMLTPMASDLGITEGVAGQHDRAAGDLERRHGHGSEPSVGRFSAAL